MISKGQDIGSKAIERIFKSLQVDDKWSVWDDRGFSWWGHRLKQRVWSEPGLWDNGFEIFRICAQTGLLTRGKPSREISNVLNDLASKLTLSAPLYDFSKGSISLFSSIYMHKETYVGYSKFFAEAAILQLIEAERYVDEMARSLDTQIASSFHPQNGLRILKDEMLNVADAIYIPKGKTHSPELDFDEYGILGSNVNNTDGFSLYSKGGFSAEFAWGLDDTYLIQIYHEADHPWLGKGVTFSLQLPISSKLKPEIDELSIVLNKEDVGKTFWPDTLGAWQSRDLKGTFVPEYRIFVPAFLCFRHMIMNFGINICHKGKLVSENFNKGTPKGDLKKILLERINTNPYNE